MKRSTFLIVGIWMAGYIPLTLSLLDAPVRECASHYPVSFALARIILPLIVFGIGAVAISQSPWYIPGLASLIDARAGNGAYESFLVRLRPLLFFGVGGFIDGLHHLWWCQQTGVQASIQSNGWFYVSGGAAFILLHVILRLRKAQAV